METLTLANYPGNLTIFRPTAKVIAKSQIFPRATEMLRSTITLKISLLLQGRVTSRILSNIVECHNCYMLRIYAFGNNKDNCKPTGVLPFKIS